MTVSAPPKFFPSSPLQINFRQEETDKRGLSGSLMYVIFVIVIHKHLFLFNLYINSFSCYHLCFFPRIFKVLLIQI